jgi:hypothetical protein
MAKPPERRDPAERALLVFGAGIVIGGIIGLLVGNIGIGAVLGAVLAAPVYIVAQRIGGGPDA